MAKLFEINFIPKDLLRLVVGLLQIGGISPIECMDGNERGVRGCKDVKRRLRKT